MSDAPDLEIDVRASARELRAADRPRGRIDVAGGTGAARVAGVRGGDVHAGGVRVRRNLPERLEPGRTYRRVTVRRRVAGTVIGARGR